MARRCCDGSPCQLLRVSGIHVILFMLLISIIHKHMLVGLVQALPTAGQCRNNLTSISKGGIYEIKSDIYDLSNTWNACQQAIAATNGQGIDKETSNVCKSAQFNLELICNMTISKEGQNNAVKIWQTPYDGANICQGNVSLAYIPY